MIGEYGYKPEYMKPDYEELRLKALMSYKVLDSAAEKDFDDLVKLASDICDTPVALITLLDEKRQWFKSKVGVELCETSREISFCTHAIEQDDIYIIHDALLDPVFQDNPLVIQEPYIRFYAGVPLNTPDGYRLGTLCVIDVVPRTLTLSQVNSLKMLARQVVNNLELRKQNQALLDEQRRLEYFRLQFQYTSEVIWVVDANTLQVEEVNQTIQTVLGYSPSQVMQELFWTFLYNSKAHQEAMLLHSIPEEDDTRTKFIARFNNLNNEEVWLSSSAVLKHGKWFIISRDVTEQRKAKLALEDARNQVQYQKKFYENILNNLPSDVAVLTLDQRYQYVNPMVCADEECREWIIGKTYRDCCLRWQRDLKLADNREAKFEEALSSGKVVSWEETYTNCEGNLVHTIRSYAPVFSPNGVSSFVISYGVDISQQKEAEATLRQAKAMIEDSMKAKEMFFSGLSHELRTPMNAVIGLTYLLEKENKQESQKENLSTLKHSAENLLKLINDILDFSKIESGKVVFEEMPVDLPQLVKSIQQSLVIKAQEKNIALTTSIENNVPATVLGDSVSLTQVLNNLVGNAIKFTNYGSVHIAVSATEVNATTATLRFSITDTGIGIAAADIESIFESFTQAKASTTRKYGGTGLGLAITKKLLALQGSSIEVSSREGVGSTFSFGLSFKLHSNTIVEETPVVELRKNLQGIHVLIVEDNKINRLIAGKFLAHWHASYDFAEDGRQAIEMYQRQEYDIVLMDLEMPNIDGYEATRVIRNSAKYGQLNTPIMALTASALPEVRDKVLGLGVVDFITKPFNPDQLLQKILHYVKENTEKGDASSIKSGKPLLSFKTIKSLAEGSNEFMLEMLDMYIEYFEQLERDYSRFFEDNNLQGFKDLKHSLAPALQMLEAAALIQHLEAGVAILDSTSIPKDALEQHCIKGSKMLFSALTQLRNERNSF